MGRPVTTGIGVPVLLRMHDPQLAALMPGSPRRMNQSAAPKAPGDWSRWRWRAPGRVRGA